MSIVSSGVAPGAATIPGRCLVEGSTSKAAEKLADSSRVSLASSPFFGGSIKSSLKHQRPCPRVVPTIRAGAGLADEQEQGRHEQGDFPPTPSGTMMVPNMMAKGFGSFGGATLERSKLDLSQAKMKVGPQIDLGGGGGKGGKNNFHGGGDGGDDGGDDDDYFGEGDEDDDGDDDGFIRRAVVELFDRASVEAVLQEWFKSLTSLPAGLRRAVEMGLVSSAQIARFMSMDARPTVARIVSRITPSEISRAFIGRMMADPAFIYKLALEQAVTIGSATWWEVQSRGDRLRYEWDIALTNVLTLAACNAAVVWSLSPTRSYGTTARSDWQTALQKLPNHMFDRSYPLREFNLPARAGSFFYKAAEMSLVGTGLGAIGGGIANGLLSVRRKQDPGYTPAVPVPSTGTSAVAFGSFLGLSGNLRYQLIYGLDRVMIQQLNHIPLAILGTTGLRVFNTYLGEPSRLAWLGVDAASASTSAGTEGTAQAFKRRPTPASEGGRSKAATSSVSSQLNQLVQSVFGSSKRRPAARGTPRKVLKSEAQAAGEGGEQPKRTQVKRKVKRKVSSSAQ